jgi:hypothetical protein
MSRVPTLLAAATAKAQRKQTLKRRYKNDSAKNDPAIAFAESKNLAEPKDGFALVE